MHYVANSYGIQVRPCAAVRQRKIPTFIRASRLVLTLSHTGRRRRRSIPSTLFAFEQLANLICSFVPCILGGRRSRGRV